MFPSDGPLPTRSFIFSILICSLFLWGSQGSYTSQEWDWRVGTGGVPNLQQKSLFLIPSQIGQESGCITPATWRAGTGMETLNTQAEATTRSSYEDFGLNWVRL